MIGKKCDVHIYIPTLGRPDRQLTLEHIPPYWLKKTFLVVQEKEKDVYIRNYGEKMVMVHPNQPHLGCTRQWVIENSFGRYIFFLDDDCQFYTRKDVTHLKNMTHEEFSDMVDLLMGWITNDNFIHVGLSVRQNNYMEENEYKDVDRMVTAYIYDAEKVNKLGVRFDRVKCMADFDVTLSLLERGYPNRVSYKYAWGQPKAGAGGGCSVYRTNEVIAETAVLLAKLHPGIVKVRKKISKEKWEGMESNVRIDVDTSWRKAYRPRPEFKARPSKNEGVQRFLR